VPSSAGLVDLRAQVDKLEAEVAAASSTAAANGAVASQWLDRLETLAVADISLSKIDIERSGGARIEGLARSPQAVSGFVQAFSNQDRQAPAQPRSIEVRHDKTTAQQVNFTMRATVAAGLPTTTLAATNKAVTP
jgi:tellurite resistance protein